MNQDTDKPFSILLVDDNEGDILLMKEGMDRVGLIANVTIATDGEKALTLLGLLEGAEETVDPNLILLDLNIPKINGLEVLERIKTDEKLKIKPVIILTGSRSNKDLSAVYKSHANCCLYKQDNLKDIINMWQVLKNFWINTVLYP